MIKKLSISLFVVLISCAGKQVKDMDEQELKQLEQLDLDLDSSTGMNSMMGGAVQAEILSHIQEVDGCYKKELAKKPTLEGNVTTDFTFETSGKISRFAISKSSLHDEKVHGCIKEVFYKMHFPTSDKPMDVLYTFKFTREK